MVDYAREHKDYCIIDIDDSGFTEITISNIDQVLGMTQEDRTRNFFPKGEIRRWMRRYAACTTKRGTSYRFLMN